MMPDRLDEIRKRMLAEQLVPQMPTDTSAELVDEQPEIGPVQPMYREPALTGSDLRLANTEKGDTARFYGDIGTALSGAIGGLSGGTYAEKARRMNTADKYLQNRGLADKITKKELVAISNEEGSPEYVRSEDAVGMEPYYQLKSGMMSGGKQYAAQYVKNKETDETAVASWKDGKLMVTGLDGTETPLDPSKWFTFKPDKSFRLPTPAGGIETVMVNPVTQKQTQGPSIAGIGDVMGTKTKQEAEARIAAAKKGLEESAKIEKSLGELEAHEVAIRTSKSPQVMAIAIGQALRTVEKRLSEPEQKTFMGDNYRSIFQQARNWADGKIKGQIPKDVRDNAIAAIQYIKSQSKGGLSATKKSYTQKAGLSPAGQSIIENISGGPTPVEPVDSRDWKTKLLEKVNGQQ